MSNQRDNESLVERSPCFTSLTHVLLALLAGPLVGLAIALLRWSIPNLAKFLIILSENFLPFSPAVDFMLALVAGALIMGLFLRLAPHVAGPGISHTTWAMSDQQGQGPWRSLPLKLLGTIICVGTGGGGLVGPGYFIGSATGISLGKLLRLRDKTQTQLLALVGAGAGVGAVLGSPIGGVLVALEALGYRNREAQLALDHIVASLLTSLAAYLTMGGLLGFSPLLRLEASILTSWSLTLLAQVVAAALVAGVVAKAYIEFFRRIARLWRGKVSLWAQPMLGTLLAGPVVILLSTGTSSALQPFEIGRPGLAPLQDALLGKLGLLTLISLTLGKAVDVGLRSGSGGSVGIFGPAMWVGGLGGAIVGFLPSFESTALLVVTGIAAGIAVAMEFPLAATVIVLEIFGWRVIAPSIIGAVMGALVWQGWDRLAKQRKQS